MATQVEADGGGEDLAQLPTDRQKRRRLSIVGIIIGVASLVIGILALTYVLVASQVCPLDAYFEEVSAGGEAPSAEYQWRRDSNNNCAWTMWDANGRPAPKEAYTNPDTPYPGPTSRPLAGFVVWFGASAALIAGGTVGARSTKRPDSASPDDLR